MIQHQANPKGTKYKDGGKIFQIYGFDIMIDSRMNAWLLEINDHPSFQVVKCQGLKGCKCEFCPISQVDLFVKKKVVSDVIKLVVRGPKNYNCKGLIPLFHETANYQNINDIRNVFYTLTKSEFMSINQFEKLHKSKMISKSI